MLSPKQHKMIRALLFTATNGRFAYYVQEKTNEKPVVYYAMDDGVWPCTVNLIQYMGGNGIELENANIIRGPSTELTDTVVGMCNMFNIVTGKYSTETPINVDMIDKARNVLNKEHESVRFHKVNPSDVLMRQQLDDFRPKNLGQAPMVSLKGHSQTHLHRIYMALAFHRVRTKYERNEQGLAIGAVLADGLSGRVYVIAHNTKNINKTYHTEVNVVQTFLRYYPHQRNSPLILYSTLQPCPMCAAMIREMLPSTTVLYAQTDTGKHMERMGPRPRCWFSMQDPLVIKAKNGENILDLPVKPLYGYDYLLAEKSDDDIATFLNKRHKVLKDGGNHSLTRNLYDDQIKNGIGNASRTLDWKLKQYDPFNKSIERKSTEVQGEARRTQRRLDIQKVIRYLQPLFAPE